MQNTYAHTTPMAGFQTNNLQFVKNVTIFAKVLLEVAGDLVPCFA